MLKKGTLIGPAEVAALKAAGVSEVVVSRLEPGDVSEDQAAAEIAKAAAGEGARLDRAFTGRCNLFAHAAGVLVVDKDAIDRLNRIDEAVTLATLPAFKPVVEGEMIATVKIIPFAVASSRRDMAVKEAAKAKPVIRVAPYKIRKIGVVSTLLPGLAPKVVEKTLKVMAERIAPAGASIIAERRVPHEQAALAKAIDDVLKAGAELVVVFGASAIADRRDVIPAALEAVGGTVEHFGMPVDPGQSDADRAGERRLGAGRAGLRAFAQGKRLRLGADAAAGRPAGDARGHHRHGRRRAADGNRHAAAAAHGARAGKRPPHRRRGAGGRALDPHGRGQQADRRNRRQAAGAHRRRTGAGVACQPGDCCHRPPARAGRGGPQGA